MTLEQLLAERELTSALIVDDGYDSIPRAQDLLDNGDGWSTFFADAGGFSTTLEEAFPAYAQTSPEELQRSDAFVAALWRLKGVIEDGLWEAVFGTFERGLEMDRTYLQGLEESLRSFGITPIPSGRELNPEGRNAPVIFADLFLGTSQNDSDMAASIDRLKKLLEGRRAKPPLVILMSRSPRLSDKKAYFRDEAGLLGSMFRVHNKDQLKDRAVIARTLERLARHHADALLMASFIEAWATGLNDAKERFLTTIRRLDLPDYGQIQQLLLNDEKQLLGGYMLDVFDRVLQHEIESCPDTILAAEALNEIDTRCYPPPYVAGSADLQQLVHKVVFQSPERLRVTASHCGAPVSFGDVLVRRPAAITIGSTGQADRVPADLPQGAVAGDGGSPHTNADDLDADVMVVLTPACDLARAGAKRVLLMAGSLEELSPKAWTYKASGVRTPILILNDGATERRFWIKWDLKNLRTLTSAQIAQALAADGSYKLAARFREGQAIELQQKLLSDVGRVGLVANMPATFPVTVEVMTCGADGKLRELTSPVLQQEGAVCFAGRDDDKDVTRLVLSEGAIEELLANIADLDQGAVYARAADTLRRLKASATLPVLLEQGIVVPAPDKKTFIPLSVPVVQDAHAGDGQIAPGQPKVCATAAIQEDANAPRVKEKAAKKPLEIVGLIARNPPPEAQFEKNNGALVIILRDVLSAGREAEVHG